MKMGLHFKQEGNKQLFWRLQKVLSGCSRVWLCVYTALNAIELVVQCGEK